MNFVAFIHDTLVWSAGHQCAPEVEGARDAHQLAAEAAGGARKGGLTGRQDEIFYNNASPCPFCM